MADTEHATAQQVSTTLVRGAAFQALALGFAYPSSDMLMQLTTQWNALLNSPQDSWPTRVRQPFQRTIRLLLGVDRKILEFEHVRLFGPAARCPLYETAYGDAERLLGRSVSLADIAGFYLAFDLHPSTDDAHREDHIGLELEFMSLLAVKEAYAIVEGWQDTLEIIRTAQRRFVQDHLGTWVDALVAQLKLCTSHPFYAALGESLYAWMHTETMRLRALPVPVGGPIADTLMGEDSLRCPYAVGDP